MTAKDKEFSRHDLEGADDQDGAPAAAASNDGPGATPPPESVPEPAPEPDRSPDRSDEAPRSREAELEAEVQAANDKLLRALAETENVRRRAERDKEDMAKYAVANFARDLLPVADNLRRALDTVPPEARERDEALNNLVVGVEMTERAMLGVLERFAVKRIDALGGRFDHNLHEALFEVEEGEKSAGTVVQVLEPGYTIAGRLLRPAKVGIAKGGPKGEAGPAPAAKLEIDAATDRARAQAYEKPGGTAGGTFDEKL